MIFRGRGFVYDDLERWASNPDLKFVNCYFHQCSFPDQEWSFDNCIFSDYIPRKSGSFTNNYYSSELLSRYPHEFDGEVAAARREVKSRMS